MKILVTGAAGCVGRQLIEQLLNIPEVEVFACDIKANPFGKHQQLEYQAFDLRSEDFIHWVKDIKPNQVVHLASILQLSKAVSRQMAYEVDVLATKKLLEACVETNVSKFIITTSGAAYGYYPENREEITEQRPTRGNQDYFYSAHKAEIEQLMADYRQHQPQLKQIVFRPGTILGPGFSGPVVDFFSQKMLTGVWGYPGPFNLIWSTDVVAYLLEGLNSDITGQFNIAGDGSLSIKQIAQLLHKPYLPLPGLLIQAALAIAKPLGLSQYGPEQVKFIKYRPVLNNNKIKADFNHQPQYTSQQVLSAFINWQQETK